MDNIKNYNTAIIYWNTAEKIIRVGEYYPADIIYSTEKIMKQMQTAAAIENYKATDLHNPENLSKHFLDILEVVDPMLKCSNTITKMTSSNNIDSIAQTIEYVACTILGSKYCFRDSDKSAFTILSGTKISRSIARRINVINSFAYLTSDVFAHYLSEEGIAHVVDNNCIEIQLLSGTVKLYMLENRIEYNDEKILTSATGRTLSPKDFGWDVIIYLLYTTAVM